MIRIFSIVIPARAFTLFVSEIVLLFACYMAAAYADPDVADLSSYLQYDNGIQRIAIVAVFIFVGFFFRNFYSEVRIRERLELFQNLCMIFGVAFLGQGLISYLDREWILPRKVMLTGSVLSIVVLFGWRLLFDSAARGATAAKRVLFLGLSPTTVQLAAQFKTHPEMGLQTIGYLETDSAAEGERPMARLGNAKDIDDVLDKFRPDSIVIGRREDIKPWWVGDFLALHFGGIRVEEASVLYERVFARKCVTEIWPSRLIFAAALEPPPFGATLQSFYTPVVAGALLLVTSPAMLAAAILIRATSRGAILERSRRMGKNDVPFDLFGFRCHDSAGESTPAGRLLIRCGLRFLPRLLNVLRGEMAIVGPRPERPVFVNRLCEEVPFYRQRHAVKPGLTGWASVHGSKKDHDSLRELEYDLYYVENLSPMLDSFILLLTLKR
ncbi:MAG TPA: sugar transferase [Bryobacteraceae bacterium]|nr:sugar transferase [Bryobacteraceae bacterium]